MQIEVVIFGAQLFQGPRRFHLLPGIEESQILFFSLSLSLDFCLENGETNTFFSLDSGTTCSVTFDKPKCIVSTSAICCITGD